MSKFLDILSMSISFSLVRKTERIAQGGMGGLSEITNKQRREEKSREEKDGVLRAPLRVARSRDGSL